MKQAGARQHKPFCKILYPKVFEQFKHNFVYSPHYIFLPHVIFTIFSCKQYFLQNEVKFSNQ